MTDELIQAISDEHGGCFKPTEFLLGRENLKKEIIWEICCFRAWHGIKMQITSAFRETGSHKYSTAIDFLMWTEWRAKQPDILKMWRIVTTWPWMGVGIYFDWNDGIGFHVDLCTPEQRQRPLRWIRTGGEYYYQSVHDGRFYHKSGAVTTLQEQISIYLKNENNK